MARSGVVSRTGSGASRSSATSATTLAFISDSTAERDRGGGMGMLGAATGLGLILGPAMAGWLGGRSLALPFFIAAGSSLLAVALAALWLPESLPAPDHRRAGSLETIHVHNLWQSLFGPVGVLLFLLFLASFALANSESVFGLFAAQELGYGPQRVGMILAVVGIVSTVGKALLIGPLTQRWGEVPIIQVSLAASSVGFLILLLAVTYPAVLLATGVFILSKTLLRTVIISLTSKRAAIGQGTAMGLSNSFMSLGRIAGPLWAGFMFDVYVHYPYLSGAAIMFIGLVVSMLYKNRVLGS